MCFHMTSGGVGGDERYLGRRESCRMDGENVGCDGDADIDNGVVAGGVLYDGVFGGREDMDGGGG
jgi:hypothetical protein